MFANHPWHVGLETAKLHALDFLSFKHADRVEGRDENDALVFHHTRSLEPQSP